MEKQLIWIAYDIGIDGDYENLYSWLDSHDARECGNSIAALYFDYKEDLAAELKSDLNDNVVIKNENRIYLIYRDQDGRMKGKFIFGRRKPSPWMGYAVRYEEEIEDV